MSDGGDILINSRDLIDRVISGLSQVGDCWHLPLFRAARDGLLGIVSPTRPDTPVGAKQFECVARGGTRPIVILVQEDDDNAVGPAGWKYALKFRWWAAAAIVHAAGPPHRRETRQPAASKTPGAAMIHIYDAEMLARALREIPARAEDIIAGQRLVEVQTTWEPDARRSSRP